MGMSVRCSCFPMELAMKWDTLWCYQTWWAAGKSPKWRLLDGTMNQQFSKLRASKGVLGHYSPTDTGSKMIVDSPYICDYALSGLDNKQNHLVLLFLLEALRDSRLLAK